MFALIRGEEVDHHVEGIDHHPARVLGDFHADDPGFGGIEGFFHLNAQRAQVRGGVAGRQH